LSNNFFSEERLPLKAAKEVGFAVALTINSFMFDADGFVNATAKTKENGQLEIGQSLDM